MMNYKVNSDRATSNGDRGSEKYSFIPNSTSKKSFQYSSKNKPCPICDRTKDRDCHWNEAVVFCHTYVELDACVPGYVYRGCKDIWGMYFPITYQSQKPSRPKGKQEFVYCNAMGNPVVKVTRRDDGEGKKRITQFHWDGQQWISGLTEVAKSQIRLYQIDNPINQAAIAQQQPLFIVEGEGKVDLLLELGVAATCSLGGAGKWKSYGYPNYLHDLIGANVVLCPDRDRPGLAHCLEIEQDFPEAQWLYAFPESPLWLNLPNAALGKVLCKTR